MSADPAHGISARRVGPVAVIALLAAAAGGAAVLLPRASTKVPAPIALASAQRTEDTVEAALARGKPVVAELGSVSCISCREMKPILAELVRAHGDRLSVVDIDVLKERQYLARYRIQLMPTQIFFDAQGREIGRHMGKISGEEILARLEKAAR